MSVKTRQLNPVQQSATPSGSTAQSDEEDESSVSRPSLYSHEPQPRPAPFELYYGDHPVRVEILDELKSNHLEGVYNLSFLLLAFALVYLFIRNIVDNGFLAGPSAICFKILYRDLRLLFMFTIPFPLTFTFSFILVFLRSRCRLSPRVVIIGHSATLAALFAGATFILFRIQLNPLLGVIAGAVVVIFALKMHSYVMTNQLLAEETEQLRKSRQAKGNRREGGWEAESQGESISELRSRHIKSRLSSGNHSAETSNKNGSKVGFENKALYPGVKYPRNVTISNLAYFIAAPTVVYETGYPRSKGVRLRYVAWHAAQIFLCLVVQYVLLMQFCVPVWRNSAPTDRLWWFSMKLALPCFFMWLLLFWGFFHCALNGIAELTGFADREFYREWWNASDLSQFWRMWNVPVHEWCIRHLYVETVSRQRLNRQAAALGTFLLSAVLHEYVCVVGFRMLRPYMFGGMMLQVPLVKWSTKWAGTRTGNCLMWIMLFVGQSWVPLLYCRDYLSMNGTLMCRV